MNTYNPPYTFEHSARKKSIATIAHLIKLLPNYGVLPFKTGEFGRKYMILPFDEQVYELMKEKYKEETV